MASVTRLVVWCVGPSLLAAAGAVACSHEKEAQTAGYQQGQVQTGQYPMGGYGGQSGTVTGYAGQSYAGGYGQGVPAGGAAAGPTTMPSAGRAAGGAGGNAQVIDPAAASVLQPVVNELAKSSIVAGSKPVGSLLVGNFQTGQKLEGQVQLQPQKCYTLVATALPPVTELSLQLVAATPLPNLSPVLATDSDTGPTAVIGKKPNCYKWPFPLAAPAKVVLQVTQGSGLAVVQVYEK